MTKTACKLFLAMITAAIVLQSAQAAPQTGTTSVDVRKMDVSKLKLQSADFKMIKADHWSITGDNLVVKGNVFLPTPTYDIYADQVVINIKNRDFDARGNLRLYQKTEEVKIVKPEEMAQFEDAAGITYQIDGVTTDVFGQQQIKVKYQRIGASLTATSVSGNILTGYFQFSNARIATADFTVKVKSGRRLANGIIKLEDAEFSSCNYMESDNAHYSISCGQAEIRPYNTNLTGSDRIQKDYSEYSVTARNCLVRAYGVPFLWLPYLYKPKSETLGLFQIQYGRSGDFGSYVSLSKKYQLLDYPAAWIRLRADWLEKRGFGSGFRGGVQFENSKTEYSFYNIYDKRQYETQDREDLRKVGIEIPHYRYDFRISNVTHITPDLDFRGHFEYMSDEYVNEDFDALYGSSNPRPVTFAALEQQFDNFAASIYFRPQVNDFFNTVEQLPTARLDVYRQEILDTNIYFQSETSFGYFKRKWREFDDLAGYKKPFEYDTARLDTVNFLYYPIKLDFLTIVPRAGVRMTAYSNSSKEKVTDNDLLELMASNDPNYGKPHRVLKDYDDDGGSRVRFVGEMGIQANTKISRSWQDVRNYWLGLDGLRHVIIPYVNYTYIPKPTVSRDYLYYFDDIDRIEKQNFFRLGLINRLQTRRGDKLANYFVMENYWDLFLENKKGYSDVGSFCTDIAMTPVRGLTLAASVALSPGDEQLDSLRDVIRNGRNVGRPGLDVDCLSRLSFTLQYEPIEDVVLNFAYQYQNPYKVRSTYSMGTTLTDIESGRAFNQFYTDNTQELTFGLRFPITPDRRTFATYKMEYDFVDGFAPTHRFGIVRQFHCFEVAAEYAYETEYDDNKKVHDNNFSITARLLRLNGPLNKPTGGMISTGRAVK